MWKKSTDVKGKEKKRKANKRKGKRGGGQKKEVLNQSPLFGNSTKSYGSAAPIKMSLVISKIFLTLFCGKSSISVPQTLTKLLLSQDGGVASAPAILYNPYLMLLCCSGQSAHSLNPIEVLYWKMRNIREQFRWCPCAMYALRKLVSYPRPAEYICKGQKPEFPDWGNAKLLIQKHGQAFWGGGQFAPESTFTSSTAADLGTQVWDCLAAWCITCAGIDFVGQSAILSVCFKQVSTIFLIFFFNSVVLSLGCWNRLRKITHKAKETWQNVPAVCCLNTFKWFNDK